MRSPRTPFVVALVLVFAGLAASCGASGGEGADPTTTVDKATTSDDVTTTSSEKRTTTTENGATTTPRRTTTTEGPTPTTVARSAEAQVYVDALAKTFSEDGAQYFTQAQATCVAGAYLDAVGVDALKAAALSPDDFAKGNGDDFDDKITRTEAMGNKVFDRFDSCGVDFDTLFRQISKAGPLTPAEDACFSRILTPDNLRRSFVADYTDKKLDADPLDTLDDCIADT